MSKVKSAPDSELAFSRSEIRSNMEFWPSTTKYSFDRPLIEEYPPGHWEEDLFTEYEYCDSLDHMVAKWDQMEPYNDCCPDLVSVPSSRASAGCVAVAGAQVLHYLHYKLGSPEVMFSQGYCDGNVNNFIKQFSYPNAEVWDLMSSEYQVSAQYTLPEAILIGYVGERVNMHYADNIIDDYSWAIPRNLKSDLFEHHGISCTHDNYDETIVARCLSEEMPVIVFATDQMIPVNFRMHCFVIDGYMKSRI